MIEDQSQEERQVRLRRNAKVKEWAKQKLNLAKAQTFDHIKKLLLKHAHDKKWHRSHFQTLQLIDKQINKNNFKLDGTFRQLIHHCSLMRFLPVEQNNGRHSSYYQQNAEYVKVNFEREDYIYRETQLGDIINRKMFSMPEKNLVLNELESKEKKDGFDISMDYEDVKGFIGCLFHTIKMVRKGFKKEEGKKEKGPQYFAKFSKFSGEILNSTDFQEFPFGQEPLSFISDQALTLDQKMQNLDTLEEKVKDFKRRLEKIEKLNSYLYERVSLNLELYDTIQREQVIEDKEKDGLIDHYKGKYIQKKQNHEFRELLNSILRKEGGDLSIDMENFEQILKYESIKSDKVVFPWSILDFGSLMLRRKVNVFIGSYLRRCQPSNIVKFKSTLIHLMKWNKGIQQYLEEQGGNILKFPQLQQKISMRKFIRTMNQKDQSSKEEEKRKLDFYINFKNLCQFDEEKSEHFRIFREYDTPAILTAEEVKFVHFYFKICSVFQILQSYFDEENELLWMLCSEYWDVLSHGMMGALLGQFSDKLKGYEICKQVGKLSGYLKQLVDTLSQKEKNVEVVTGKGRGKGKKNKKVERKEKMEEGSVQQDSKASPEQIEFEFNCQVGFGFFWPEGIGRIYQDDSLDSELDSFEWETFSESQYDMEISEVFEGRNPSKKQKLIENQKIIPEKVI